MAETINERMSSLMARETLIPSMDKKEVIVEVTELSIEDEEETPLIPSHAMSRRASISSMHDEDQESQMPKGSAEVCRSDILSLVSDALQSVKSSSTLTSILDRGRRSDMYGMITSIPAMTESALKGLGEPQKECVVDKMNDATAPNMNMNMMNMNMNMMNMNMNMTNMKMKNMHMMNMNMDMNGLRSNDHNEAVVDEDDVMQPVMPVPQMMASPMEGPMMMNSPMETPTMMTSPMQRPMMKRVPSNLASIVAESTNPEVRGGVSSSRHFRRKMDRNAMANPGASSHMSSNN